MIAAISPSKDKNLLHQKTLGHYTGRSDEKNRDEVRFS